MILIIRATQTQLVPHGMDSQTEILVWHITCGVYKHNPLTNHVTSETGKILVSTDLYLDTSILQHYLLVSKTDFYNCVTLYIISFIGYILMIKVYNVNT